jgi:acetyl/propionyl-CoA carboxylase alpha subunit
MRKLLIANRGEIACRIIRSAKALGVETVAVYSEADATALHVGAADEAVAIGPPKPAESYLQIDKLLEAARSAGADAVHPGYGFLAENAEFAAGVIASGLHWVGPEPQQISTMGDKERARRVALEVGVPVLPGSDRITAADDEAALIAAAEDVGFPLLVKASAGGGGIGMRRVDSVAQLAKVVEATQTMAERSFGDPTIFMERYVARARHIEIQVFGFGDGRAVHFFERECSIQRRFQKIIEEAPACNLPGDVRDSIAASAVALTVNQSYRGAGTVEFIVDAESHEFFFLEMNTRIQVEHPVTEMITGYDLVALQLRLARGDDLSGITQDNIQGSGHAIECRIYAENPAKMFLPSPGDLDVLIMPDATDRVRIDTGVKQGDKITAYYDPMIAKLICHGESREHALDQMSDSLSAARIEGISHNLDFLANVIAHDDFRRGDVFTGFIDMHKEKLIS